MRGFGGIDSLIGGDGNDLLIGGNSGDVLTGGAGHDTKTGGAGADTFVFASGDSPAVEPALAGGADTITDFDTGSDMVIAPLDATDTNYIEIALGADPDLTFGAARTAAEDAFNGTIRFALVEIDSTDSILFGDEDGDQTADMAIILQGVLVADIDQDDIMAALPV